MFDIGIDLVQIVNHVKVSKFWRFILHSNFVTLNAQSTAKESPVTVQFSMPHPSALSQGEQINKLEPQAKSSCHGRFSIHDN